MLEPAHTTTLPRFSPWLPTHLSATPQLTREADTVAQPADSALYQAVVSPQPIPGAHLPTGSGVTTCWPSSLRTTVSELWSKVQEVEAKVTLTVSPTWTCTVCPFFESSTFTSERL